MQVKTTELLNVKVLAEGLAFPEGPMALANGSVIVCETSGGRLTQIDQHGKMSTIAEVTDGPNGAAFGPDGFIYVCNNGGMTSGSSGIGRIQRVNPTTGEFSDLYTHCQGKSLMAPNDIVFDKHGGFWFTEFRGNRICYATVDGSLITSPISNCDAPNGIGISPDGDTLYWAETNTRQVHRRRIVGPGQIEESPGHSVPGFFRHLKSDPSTLVVGLPGCMGLDSLGIDIAGNICVGTLVESGITEINPQTGEFMLHKLPNHLEDGAVTNICFGGNDMTTAFLTCSITGRVVSCKWHTAGLALNFKQ